MENRNVGIMILGLSLILLLVVISYDNALEEIVNSSCTHGEACPMHTTLKTQKIVSYSLLSLIVAGGAFMTFYPWNKKKQKTALKKDVVLSSQEKKTLEVVDKHEGSVYQSDLVKELKLSKVKVSRLLDKLEGKKLIERHRRGMTNIVIRK